MTFARVACDARTTPTTELKGHATMPDLRRGTRTTAHVVVVADFAEGIQMRQRGTYAPHVWIESVRSVLAGNLTGLRATTIEVSPAARRHPDFALVEPHLDAMRPRRSRRTMAA